MNKLAKSVVLSTLLCCSAVFASGNQVKLVDQETQKYYAPKEIKKLLGGLYKKKLCYEQEIKKLNTQKANLINKINDFKKAISNINDEFTAIEKSFKNSGGNVNDLEKIKKKLEQKSSAIRRFKTILLKVNKSLNKLNTTDMEYEQAELLRKTNAIIKKKLEQYDARHSYPPRSVDAVALSSSSDYNADSSDSDVNMPAYPDNRIEIGNQRIDSGLENVSNNGELVVDGYAGERKTSDSGGENIGNSLSGENLPDLGNMPANDNVMGEEGGLLRVEREDELERELADEARADGVGEVGEEIGKMEGDGVETLSADGEM